MNKERVIILIDGSNFYYGRKDSGCRPHRLTEFSYFGLAEHLAKGRDVIARNYYIGALQVSRGNSKGQEMRKKQQQLFAHLKSSSQQFSLILGSNRRQGSSYHEKGVDVRMAVDIVAGACDNTYDTAIVISSDSDLVPAIQHARQQGKKVEYVGFKHAPTNDLMNNTDVQILLTKRDMEGFIS